MVLGVLWKDWCWSWNSNTLATWCEELTDLKRPQCWERLTARGEGDDRGWDGWMASLTQWTWVWVNSRSWWCTGRPGVLPSMGLQSHTWLSNWTELNIQYIYRCLENSQLMLKMKKKEKWERDNRDLNNNWIKSQIVRLLFNGYEYLCSVLHNYWKFLIFQVKIILCFLTLIFSSWKMLPPLFLN